MAADSILLVTDGARSVQSDRRVRPEESWGDWLARGTGSRIETVPKTAPPAVVLDAVNKREARWVVTGLEWRRESMPPGTPVFDQDLARLLCHATCPVLTVQSWARRPEPSGRCVAVVGVDGTAASVAAASAAAELLRAGSRGRPATLVLVHGSGVHPAEQAARRSWTELRDSMRVDRHGWVETLAEMLRGNDLAVEVVVKLAWAPDLISGVVLRSDADLTALGIGMSGDRFAARLTPLHQRVIRGTPCPMLTVGCRWASRR